VAAPCHERWKDERQNALFALRPRPRLAQRAGEERSER
jgi:hypothetical protein